jgi:undecaprenyl diphosphate synthase
LTDPQIKLDDIPVHVAIIMDGNGRWAKKRFLPRLEGHRQGAKAVRRVVEFCRRSGIRYLTLYAFSTENWNRPEGEVSGLMKLLSQFLDSELNDLHKNDIRFRTIGETNRLPDKLVEKIDAAKSRTENNKSMNLNIALSYGGRSEIVRACCKIAQAFREGQMTLDDVDEKYFSSMLDTAGIPDPDLLIRTGGDIRVSNFLLWQLAYSELYFTNVLWPDFDDDVFSAAIQDYKSRQRRFGMVPEITNSPWDEE